MRNLPHLLRTIRLHPAHLGLLLFTGCLVTVPTSQEIAASDPGPTINESKAIELIEKHTLADLKDPESARFQVQRGPYKYYTTHLSADRSAVYGWRIDYTVNAKNSYGGYTGPKKWAAFFYRGHLAILYSTNRNGVLDVHRTWPNVELSHPSNDAREEPDPLK